MEDEIEQQEALKSATLRLANLEEERKEAAKAAANKKTSNKKVPKGGKDKEGGSKPEEVEEKKEEHHNAVEEKSLDLFLPKDFTEALKKQVKRPFVFGPISFTDLNLSEDTDPFRDDLVRAYITEQCETDYLP
jgi:hypothetical protein